LKPVPVGQMMDHVAEVRLGGSVDLGLLQRRGFDSVRRVNGGDGFKTDRLATWPGRTHLAWQLIKSNRFSDN